MCGIAGVVGEGDLEVLTALASRMGSRLAHRGPDAAGEFVGALGGSPDPGLKFALAHRRLSIIDVEGSPQPCVNESGDVVVTFNGEIYNYVELRSDLQRRGHEFRTAGDTEVLVHGWEEWGSDLPKRLDGMFSFVLVDTRRRLLFGAVDPMGQKPLFFTPPGSPAHVQQAAGSIRFAFASELVGFEGEAGIALEADRTSLLAGLLHDYVPSPRSPYQGVSRLRPGHFLQVDLDGSDSFSVSRYWSPDPWAFLHSPIETSPEDAAEELLELLGDAVEKRLISDVPLGVLLSGGIDSTMIAGLVRERSGHDDIDTFSIGFEHREFDESDWAREVSRALGTRHHERLFAEADMLRELEQVTQVLSEPFADPSILPTSMLSCMARERVTVALGGDGGDELFVGYDPFRAVALARRLENFPLRGALHRLVRRAPMGDGNLPIPFKVERLLRGLRGPAHLRPAVWMGAFDPEGVERLLGEPLAVDLDTLYGVSDWHRTRTSRPTVGSIWEHDLASALSFFQLRYLPDDILVKVDRASMAHGLEVRSPFLDRRLVEWANRLPLELRYERARVGLGNGKKVLRDALMLLADRSRKPWKETALRVTQRRKKGFGIPTRRWLRTVLSGAFESVAREQLPSLLSLESESGLDRLLSEVRGGSPESLREAWYCLMLGLWSRRRSAASPGL